MLTGGRVELDQKFGPMLRGCTKCLLKKRERDEKDTVSSKRARRSLMSENTRGLDSVENVSGGEDDVESAPS